MTVSGQKRSPDREAKREGEQALPFRFLYLGSLFLCARSLFLYARSLFLYALKEV